MLPEKPTEGRVTVGEREQDSVSRFGNVAGESPPVPVEGERPDQLARGTLDQWLATGDGCYLDNARPDELREMVRLATAAHFSNREALIERAAEAIENAEHPVGESMYRAQAAAAVDALAGVVPSGPEADLEKVELAILGVIEAPTAGEVDGATEDEILAKDIVAAIKPFLASGLPVEPSASADPMKVSCVACGAPAGEWCRGLATTGFCGQRVDAQSEEEDGEVGLIGPGTPHARMVATWERMGQHEEELENLVGYSVVSSTYPLEMAYTDAFTKLVTQHDEARADAAQLREALKLSGDTADIYKEAMERARASMPLSTDLLRNPTDELVEKIAERLIGLPEPSAVARRLLAELADPLDSSSSLDEQSDWRLAKCACETAPNREAAMVEPYPGVWCDPCIAPLVKALNEGNIATVASCCGHGQRSGRISLADGRELLILPSLEAAEPVDVVSVADAIRGKAAPMLLQRVLDGEHEAEQELARIVLGALPPAVELTVEDPLAAFARWWAAQPYLTRQERLGRRLADEYRKARSDRTGPLPLDTALTRALAAVSGGPDQTGGDDDGE